MIQLTIENIVNFIVMQYYSNTPIIMVVVFLSVVAQINKITSSISLPLFPRAKAILLLIVETVSKPSENSVSKSLMFNGWVEQNSS